jgi:20S proteasome alpha/beta subunit
MACVIGSVCKGGIVVVSDQKVKAGQIIYPENKVISVEKYENLTVVAAGAK